MQNQFQPSESLCNAIVTPDGRYRFESRLVHPAGRLLAAPILDKISLQDGKVNLIPVAGRNCRCKSVWCPTCFRYLYRTRIKKQFADFDWQYTRQVVLTVAPDMFEDPLAAFDHIRSKHCLSEFIKRLSRGVRQKIGKEWLWKYMPVNIIRWAWFLEWHENGSPHYHVFIQVDKKGKDGMIGGDFLRDSWKLAQWVKEEYFRNEEHFKNLTGYYADKGYFEKNKKHQGILPEAIMAARKKIVRYSSSCRVDEKENIPAPASEYKNYLSVGSYFIKKKLESQKSEEHKSSVDYKALLARCGKSTYIQLDLENYRLEAICGIEFKEWKESSNGNYYADRGYLRILPKTEVEKVLTTVQRVISLKRYRNIKQYCRNRTLEIKQQDHWRNHVIWWSYAGPKPSGLGANLEEHYVEGVKMTGNLKKDLKLVAALPVKYPVQGNERMAAYAE